MGIKRKKAEKTRKSYPQGVGAVIRSYPQPLSGEMQVLLQGLSTAKVILGILWIAGVETVGKLGRKRHLKTAEITPNGESKCHEPRTKGKGVFRLAGGRVLFSLVRRRGDLRPRHRDQNPPSVEFIINEWRKPPFSHCPAEETQQAEVAFCPAPPCHAEGAKRAEASFICRSRGAKDKILR